MGTPSNREVAVEQLQNQVRNDIRRAIVESALSMGDIITVLECVKMEIAFRQFRKSEKKHDS